MSSKDSSDPKRSSKDSSKKSSEVSERAQGHQGPEERQPERPRQVEEPRPGPSGLSSRVKASLAAKSQKAFHQSDDEDEPLAKKFKCCQEKHKKNKKSKKSNKRGKKSGKNRETSSLESSESAESESGSESEAQRVPVMIAVRRKEEGGMITESLGGAMSGSKGRERVGSEDEEEEDESKASTFKKYHYPSKYKVSLKCFAT